MIPHFANEPYQVLGKINCNDEITKEANCNPEDGGTPPPPPPVECPSECASCKAQGNEENCSVDYYCVDDFGELEEEPFETVSGIAICGGGGYVDNGEGTIPSYEYDIYTYCILDNDPCNDLFHIYTMDQSEVMSTTNETLLFWLIAQGITPTPSIIHGETVDETDPSQFSDPDFLTWTTNMLSVFDIPPCPCNVIPLIINEEETARGEALHLSTTDKNRINNIVMDGFHSDIFPNPFNRDIRVNIQIANEGKVDIYVHDIMGKEYFCSGFSVTAGMNGFTISSEEANISANGLYYLTIKDEQGNQVTHKIVRLE
jgi:hypothetical protein